MELVEQRANGSVIVVQPGFNGTPTEDNVKALIETADPDIFDPKFLELTQSGADFILVLGSGYEKDINAMGPGSFGHCAGLASIEQLRFLQQRGLKQIVMARRHGILVQNARAIGIDVIVGGE